MPDEDAPTISVVIPCYNGERSVGRQLDALSAQAAPVPFEVVVADNGSTDGTAALVEDHARRDPRIRRVDASVRRGASAARNMGIRASRGRWILLCDADDIVAPGWIAAYAAAFEHGATVVAGGINQVGHDGEVVQYQRTAEQMPFADGPHQWASTCNSGFTREVFDATEGFDETLLRAQDRDFFFQTHELGHRLTYVPAAVVLYYTRSGFATGLRQGYHWGRADVDLYLKWRPHGMVATSPLSPLKALPTILYRTATGRETAATGGSALGVRWGRMIASVRRRTLYL